ncbi:hypothetical protein A1O3_04774 [Capronia epimyces CBS 606.96]|uniref:Alpha and gamma adaptin binding protein p34 n=1 Tax=Capronia epimyces CBS 606.96 TaxID=1182542 RepID=W9XU64_9EURO|nr:uncharacterized protein A1O3_04774 [Capronia epimyces CBS 606.96]EXJ84107.1 hypothetical protein A1O3_04774 [Capronia epimyces CBS 606.96]
MAVPPPAQSSSLRLLVLAPSSEAATIPPFPALLEAITGAKPSTEVTSFAGYTSHPPLPLRTKYYSSDVTIWCDELPAVAVSTPQNNAHETVLVDKSCNPVPLGVGIPEDPSTDLSKQVEVPETDEDHTPSTLDEWKEQMLSPAASEVRAVIGGIVLVLPISSRSSSLILDSYYSLIEAIHALREAVEEESYGRDVASIVVLQPTSPTVSPGILASTAEQIEDACLSDRGILGWDFVAWDGEVQKPGKTADQADVRNEYGEKTGIRRVIEVLEGIDWSAAPSFGDLEDIGAVDFDKLGAGEEASSAIDTLANGSFFDLDYELQQEMMELKMSMLDQETLEDGEPAMKMSRPDHEPQDGDENASLVNADSDADAEVEDEDELQVEELQGLMERVVAIRETASEMPKGERERFAKREIAKIMLDMG